MVLSITSLKVRKFSHLFRIWPYSFRCVLQLQKSSKCVAFKTIGFGNPSYTMTLWNSEQDMREYFFSGAHAMAMKNAVKWANEIKSVRINRDTLIDWHEAKQILDAEGKTYSQKTQA